MTAQMARPDGPSARGRAWRGARLRSALVTIGFLAAVLLVWQLATVVFAVPHFILPSPVLILEAGWEGRRQLLDAAQATGVAVLLGFVVGNVTGVVGAIAVASSPAASRVLMPLALGLRSVPIIALAPFLTLYLGRGLVAITAVTTLIVFFPTMINGVLGMRSVDPGAVELFELLHAGWLASLFRLRLPAALPSLFAALRISAPSAVLGAMVAEWVVAGRGLGYLVLSSSITARTALMWATVVASTALAGLAFAAVAAVERRVIPWSGLAAP